MLILALIVLNLTLWSLPVEAQIWTGVLDPARAIDWTTKGAGPIPSRTTVCASMTSSNTAAEINTEIANCASNQVVQLAAGTYTLSVGLVFSGKNNVTLRGVGPDQTILKFTGVDTCGGKPGFICVTQSSQRCDSILSGCTVANWTAGYTRGATSITVDTTTNLFVGKTMVLQQLNDTFDTDPTDDVHSCNGTPTCTQSGTAVSDYGQSQFVTVTSINGSTIGITPGLYMPNWRSAKSPRALWLNQSVDDFVTGDGIENLSVEYNSTPIGAYNISFFNAKNSWVKNVRSIKPNQKHVNLYMSHHITVRDSYMFNTTNSVNDSYAIDFFYAGDCLIENNIAQRVATPWLVETNSPGNVIAYNYSINNLFHSGRTATEWMQASAHDHGGGSSYVLFEGNEGNGTVRENYYGMTFFFTDFRNRWHGWEPPPANIMFQSVAVHNYARARFHNYIGNVLGTNGYHTIYETYATGPTTNTGGSCPHSIYAIGLGGNCDNGGTGPYPTNDVNTRPSLMRWGNCDTVTGTSSCRFQASEVPSTIAKFRNPVPANNTLPASFYLSAPPSWWKVNGITPAWPPIGPDVTRGGVTGTGTSVNAELNGRVYRIPSRICFEDVMGGTFNDTTARNFNATLCYATAGGAKIRPNSPTKLKRL